MFVRWLLKAINILNANAILWSKLHTNTSGKWNGPIIWHRSKINFQTKSLQWTFLRPMATIICKQYYLICIFPLLFGIIFNEFAEHCVTGNTIQIDNTTKALHDQQSCAHFISSGAQFKKSFNNFFICSQRNYCAEVKFRFIRPQWMAQLTARMPTTR